MCMRLFVHATELIIPGVDVATYGKAYIDLTGSVLFSARYTNFNMAPNEERQSNKTVESVFFRSHETKTENTYCKPALYVPRRCTDICLG